MSWFCKKGKDKIVKVVNLTSKTGIPPISKENLDRVIARVKKESAK